MQFKWETLFPENEPDHGNAYFQTDRAKIFGGWLVRESASIDDSKADIDYWENVNVSIVFVPDPNHEWTIAY